jgi:inner membrane protein
MASPLTHALVGATLAAACHFRWKLWVVGVASALLPDLDAAGYWLGVPYGSFWGSSRIHPLYRVCCPGEWAVRALD